MAPALRISEILAGRTCGKVTPLALGKMLERENYAAPRWVAGLAVSHATDSHHPQGIDYWYLHYAAVRPEHQGQGWGGAAIREGLTRARSERLPVYLETTKESSVALYLKLGLKVVGEWDVSKAGPHFWSMLCEN